MAKNEVKSNKQVINENKGLIAIVAIGSAVLASAITKNGGNVWGSDFVADTLDKTGLYKAKEGSITQMRQMAVEAEKKTKLLAFEKAKQGEFYIVQKDTMESIPNK